MAKLYTDTPSIPHDWTTERRREQTCATRGISGGQPPEYPVWRLLAYLREGGRIPTFPVRMVVQLFRVRSLYIYCCW